MEREPALTIGALAGATGAKVETIRWYERVGLLPTPPRTAGNYRAYTREHLARLAFIRRSRGLGFTLDQVRVLLRLADDRGHDCDAVDRIAGEHLAAVERKIDDLSRLAAELRRIGGRCRGGTIAECRILEALSPEAHADGKA